jgi:hypothetical protein
MDIDQQWFDVEFLIFSAHKTATQTITASLNVSGIKSRHAHVLYNMALDENQFAQYLIEYHARERRNLKIISVFRDPMDRLISSFFQSLEENKHAWTDTHDEERGSGDFDMPLRQLIDLFSRYCETVDGWGESITDLCTEMQVAPETLTFSEVERIGINRLDNCALYLMRFDLMLPRLTELLGFITGRNVVLSTINQSKDKVYAARYLDLRAFLKLPPSIIVKVHESRRRLIELFYPGCYEAMLNEKLARYGAGR